MQNFNKYLLQYNLSKKFVSFPILFLDISAWLSSQITKIVLFSLIIEVE